MKEGHDEGNKRLIEGHLVIGARRVPVKGQVRQFKDNSDNRNIGGGSFAVGAIKGVGAEADVGARGKVRAGAAISAGRGAAKVVGTEVAV